MADSDGYLARALAGLSEATSKDRLLLALKTALAAGLAWVVAQLMPGPAAQYPYYAPLGALVSMYPTVADSVKKGLQSLIGLALGIAVAVVAGSFTGPTALAVAVVVGLGVLIGGLPRMGQASDWVPMAALFVLVIGGDTRDEFSTGYLLQMAAGVAIGFAVNWLIYPPLHYRGITPAFRRLRHALGRQLDEMALALAESWPPDHHEWAKRDVVLADTASQVREAVEKAERGARHNPRRLRHRRNLEDDLDDLRAVERATFQVRHITDTLAGVIWEEGTGTTVPRQLTPDLAGALASTAALLRAWGDSDSAGQHLEEARAAIEALDAGLPRAAVRDASVTAAAGVALALARLTRAVGARMGEAPPGGATPGNS